MSVMRVTHGVCVQERGGGTLCDRGPAMASEAAVRLGLSPRHQRENVPHRPDVGASPHEHDHHWLHDDFLQVSLALLASSLPSDRAVTV